MSCRGGVVPVTGRTLHYSHFIPGLEAVGWGEKESSLLMGKKGTEAWDWGVSDCSRVLPCLWKTVRWLWSLCIDGGLLSRLGVPRHRHKWASFSEVGGPCDTQCSSLTAADPYYVPGRALGTTQYMLACACSLRSSAGIFLHCPSPSILIKRRSTLCLHFLWRPHTWRSLRFAHHLTASWFSPYTSISDA